MTDKEYSDLKDVQLAGIEATRKLQEFDREKKRRRAADLIGRTYKYRNCYSCPETEADYWWLYAVVTGMNESGDPLVFDFEKCVHGEIRVRTSIWFRVDDYKEIPRAEFDAAWSAIFDGLKPPAPSHG